MTYTLQKLPQLSGRRASIYTIVLVESNENLLNQFVRENITDFSDEIDDIFGRLNTIAHKTGAREKYFKPAEGVPGDGVEALFDEPNKHLRLYCIRNGMVNIIIGGGGEKPKSLRALQESDKLKDENYFLRDVSQLLIRRLKEKEIKWSKNGMDLEGNLGFEEADL
jgi:hypothetical protein